MNTLDYERRPPPDPDRLRRRRARHAWLVAFVALMPLAFLMSAKGGGEGGLLFWFWLVGSIIGVRLYAGRPAAREPPA